MQPQSGNLANIDPNLYQTHDCAGKTSLFPFESPKQLRNRNVLVEVIGRGKTKRAAYCSNSLTVQLSDNYGQLPATDDTDRNLLPGVYLKAGADG